MHGDLGGVGDIAVPEAWGEEGCWTGSVRVGDLAGCLAGSDTNLESTEEVGLADCKL